MKKNKGYDNNLGIGVGIESISLIESENPEKGLVSDITCDIDTADYTVSLTVPHSAILTGLKFDIKLSEGYSISPASGDEVNFELEESSEESSETPSPKRYKKVFTLTAKDGTAKEYKVYITKGSSNECVISSFKFINEKNNGKNLVKDITETITESESGNTISLTVPNIADLTGLKPTIEISSGARVSPANEEAKTFTSGSEVEYTVTAQDGTTKTYKVTVTKELAPKLTGFNVTANPTNGIQNNIEAELTHTEDSNTGIILLKLPKDRDTDISLTGLTPTIEVPTGCTVSPESGKAVSGDISSARFTLTKTDTGSTRTYTVQAVKGPYISSFKFETGSVVSANTGISTTVNGVINHANNNITVIVPNTVNLGQTITPTIEAESGVTVVPSTGIPQTFNENTPVQYKVTSNGIEKTYEVTVTKELAPKLTKFEIAAKSENGIKDKVEATLTHDGADNAATGTIKLKFEHKVATHHNDIDLTGLTPTIEPNTGGYTVNPASGAAVTGDISTSGSNTVTLTTALGSKRVYTVEAVKGPYISSFKFETTSGVSTNTGIDTEVTGQINHENNTIALTVPASVKKDGQNKVTLTPTIEFRGDATLNIQPASGNSQEFTSGEAVQYIVTGKEGMQKTYDVTVTRTPSTEAVIKSFEIESGHSGNISEIGTDDKGRIVVPVTTAPANTTPDITQSDYATITSPTTGAQSFTYDNPVTYTVTSEDTKTQKTYEIYIYDKAKTITDSDTLKVTKSDGTEITPSSKVITENSRVITVTVPSSTTDDELKTLTLTLTSASSGLSIEPIGAQDFSGGAEVKYTLKESSSSNAVGHYWVKIAVAEPAAK
ncbi:DUF5018 domain-containing protein [Ichthyobacterium seriolicida]|uniref:Pkd domain containing protein n=1 Tax=Ichthyobacterium seriolicida TaxID=242600 RepID=A0A1J1DWZ9_9FLAO|nr:DUF5018 domain-containing protein [Ichthyobacterium seriolicida]BAV94383.1 pkd domain containing protein [Ichthyobacterium seriolicida]